MSVMPTLSAEDGARTSLYCATSYEASDQGGEYFVPFGKLDDKARRWTRDPKAVDGLWSFAIKQLQQHGFHFEI